MAAGGDPRVEGAAGGESKQMASDTIDQYEFELALDERLLREALERGAEIEAGALTHEVLQAGGEFAAVASRKIPPPST